MPIQLFQIFLDNNGVDCKEPTTPYLAGEVVTGKFIIDVVESYSHSGIFLKWEGHAIIKWTEESSCFENTVAKQHRARRQFFDAIIKYSSANTLSEGTHVFPFQYRLPQNLPSSLTTPTITIYYKMEALIQKTPKPRREVGLLSVKGLYHLPEVLPEELKGSVSQVKSFSTFGFCNFFYTSVGIRIPRAVYAPGDILDVNMAVLTDLQFTFVSLSLIQEIKISTKEKTLIERRTMVKQSLDDLVPQASDDYHRWVQLLKIPLESVVSSTSEEYPDVMITYFLKFSAEATKFPYKGIKLQLPLTVVTGPVNIVEEPDEEEHESVIFEQSSDEGGNTEEFQKKEELQSLSLSPKIVTPPKIVMNIDHDETPNDNDPDDCEDSLVIITRQLEESMIPATMTMTPSKRIGLRGSRVFSSSKNSSPITRRAFHNETPVPLDIMPVKNESTTKNETEL